MGPREALKTHLVDDVIFHLHKNDVTMAEKLVTAFFEFSMLKAIDSSLETKMIMKFLRKWHKAPD